MRFARTRTLLCLALVVASRPLWSAPASDPAALLDAGHFKRARAILEPRVRANPNDALALHQLSRVELAYDNAPRATDLALRSVELEPKNADFHTHLAHVYGWQSESGTYLKQLKYVNLLKQELAAALSLNPQHLDALLIKAVFLWVAPGVVGGSKQESAAVVAQMVRLNPERGYLAQARIASKQKDPAKVAAAFRRALGANPHSYAALTGLANVLCCAAEAKDMAEAERLAKQAVQEAPDRVGGYDSLARVYAAAQRWSDLDTTLAQAERVVPDDLAPYFHAAERLELDGADKARAENYLHKYLTQEREGDEPTAAAARKDLAHPKS